MMIIYFITRLIRTLLIGKEQKFIFSKVDASEICIPNIKKVGIYIHIPFCKSMCPYCPYNRIKYDKNLANDYLAAILNEIDLYKAKLGKIEITSIYIGGGTPTNLIDELGIILNKIKQRFKVIGDIYIETSPSDLNQENITKLKNYGIKVLSIGVQSFENKNLRLLGRNYKEEKIKTAIELAKKAGFESINVDLMFTLPDQSIQSIVSDLDKAASLNVDQITEYPLFTFPYTPVGKYKKLKKIKMPNIFLRREQYRIIHNYLIDKGFNRVSVWGFKKGDVPKYSSVTRDFYIGLGAGAASSFPEMFYFNTFSVSEYIKTLKKNTLPISLKMNINHQLSNYYWFYWKLYETHFSHNEVVKIFGRDKKIFILIRLMLLSGLLKMTDNSFSLTEKGSFWVHLAQNYFMLNYINKVWSVSMKEPWPNDIKI